MSTTELQHYVDERTPEERQWLAAYLFELERRQNAREPVELDRRMAEMDAGQKRLNWEQFEARLDAAEHQGQ
jgi:hypothetical protein